MGDLRGSRGAIASFASALLLLVVVPGPARAQDPTAPAPAAPKRNIAGPGDYRLRERIIHLLGRDPSLSREKIDVILVNGGAVFSGEISNCALKKRVLSLAAVTRGVINVTDEMTVPRGDVSDADILKAVEARLKDASGDLGLKDLQARVEDGILTLDGTVRDIAARGRAEDLAGTILGITRIANRLLPADAPGGGDDASLQKAVVAYLGDFRQFGFPSDIGVKVQDGAVTLSGRVSLYLARQQAALVASLVRGVRRVDNRLKVDPGVPPGMRRVQAAP